MIKIMHFLAAVLFSLVLANSKAEEVASDGTEAEAELDLFPEEVDEKMNEIADDYNFVKGSSCSSDNFQCSCTDDPEKARSVCLSEDCVMAAATILSSLDRNSDPCEDFYQFACGGWIQRSLMTNTDRFTALDKRNQNIIAEFLSDKSDKNVNKNDAETKAKDFYSSCMVDSADQDRENLLNLQSMVAFSGGWNLSSNFNRSFGFQERVETLHNKLGLSVLFTWGVIEHGGSNRLAIIAGGWNDALVVEEGERMDYLDLMTKYTILLAQVAEDPIIISYDEEIDVEALKEKSDDNAEIEIVLEEEAAYSATDYEDTRNNSTNNNITGSSSSLGDDNLSLILNALNPFSWTGSNKDNGTSFGGDEDEQLSIEEVFEANGNEEKKNESSDWDDFFLTDGGGVHHHVEDDATIQRRSQDYQSDENPRSSQFPGEEKQAADINSLFEQNLNMLLERNNEIEAAMEEVIHFETLLANITSKPVDSNSLVSYSLDRLAKSFPFLNWLQFFDGAFEDLADRKLEIEALSATEVLVQEDFLRGVNDLVKLYRSTAEGNRVLVNYMIWRMLAAFYPDRPPDEAQRKERCLKEAEEMFAPAVTAMYIKAKGVEQSERVVQQVDLMVDTMKSAFKENLPKLSWMSAASLQSAEAKLESMIDLIGYPKFVLNSTWVDSIFEEVHIDDFDYLTNVITHRSFLRKLETEEYFKPYSRGRWNDFAHMANIATVNAYYNQASNTMVVPIGMLQPPLFWAKPKSLTFGAFGIVVAHEITHAFDDVGIQYDEEGFFEPLYDNKTIEAFHKTSDCVRNQYSSYTLLREEDLNVDGNITLGENIADHGGLRIAEIAYEKWIEGQNAKEAFQEAALPALEFSDEQLFYLGYALPWCAVHSDNVLKNHIVKDEHAPDRFRVMGPLSNSAGFAKAFNCPAESVMNPSEKCNIW